MNSEKPDEFEYSYSAGRQEEIRKIMGKYKPAEEDKLARLKKLDADAEKPGMIAGIAVGIVGTMLLGLGMCCTMVWSEKLFVLGIIIGIIGILFMCAACPLYKRITKKQREKIAPVICELAEELMKDK